MMRQAMIARARVGRLTHLKDGVATPADVAAAMRELLTYIELLERKVDDLQHEVRRPAWWPGGPH